MGDGSGDGGLSAIVIGRMNLDERIAEVAQFDADGAIRGGDGFFFSAEGSAFDPLHAEAESRGFTKDYGGEFFSIRRKGYNGEKMSGPTFFHEERGRGGIKGSLRH